MDKPEIRTRIRAYLINHLRVLISSLGRLFYSPLASLMTVAVISIAIALPTGFYILLNNVQKVSGGWDGAAKISAYLNLDIKPQQLNDLENRLRKRTDVEALKHIDREEALAEFRELSGFGTAMDALSENPLPDVFIITPKIDNSNPIILQQLVQALEKEPQIDSVQLDMQWVKRLSSITNIIQRGLIIIASLLGLAVVLVIGNTIRLDIQHRRPEIVVIKLIGGTNAFIRRPFLYTGFWYGLFGGFFGWLLVSIGLWLLQGPTRQLAGLYNSQFKLINLGLSNTALLLGSAILLGYIGSWVAVGRHLKSIEPGG